MPQRYISPIAEIITDIKAGKMVILVDDENRENEGDFVIAAEFATAQTSALRGTRDAAQFQVRQLSSSER